MSAQITVWGKPVAKARPGFTKSGHVYTPRKTLLFEKEVGKAYRYSDNPMYGKDVKLVADIRFYFKIPKSRTLKEKREIEENGYYNKKPDIDNLVKAVLDGLNGVAFEDDRQVVCINAMKQYDRKELGERTEVVIFPL